MTMNDFTKLIVDSHIDDLRREAERAALRAAAARAKRERPAGRDYPITIRRGALEDQAALNGLAALDSAPAPVGPVLVAEVAGELRAALSLTDGAVIADPFHPTAAVVELLLTFAGEGRPGRSSLLRGWRRRRTRNGAAQRPASPALA